MPVFEQGYRGYDGEDTRRSPIWAIAWRSFKPRLNRQTWLLTLLGCGPVIFVAIGLAVSTLGGGGGRAPGTTWIDAFERDGDLRGPNYWFKGLLGGHPGPFFELLFIQGYVSIVIPALACAGLIADDRRTGALHFYFSRPVARLEYLAGKILATAMFVLMLTGAPLFLLWVEAILLSDRASYALDTILVPVGILLGSAMHALYTAGVTLFASSIVKVRMRAALAVVAWVLLTAMVGAILADTMDYPFWFVLSPQYALGGVTAPGFGLQINDWLATPLLLLHALVLPGLCLAAVSRRLSHEVTEG